MPRARLALLLVLVACGCPRPGVSACAPSEPALLEVRDGAGVLEVALKRPPAAGATGSAAASSHFDLCDGSHRRTGAAIVDAETVTLLDARGALAVRLHRPAGDDWFAEGPAGPRLRVHLDGPERRVLGTDGVPFGWVRDEGEHAAIFDRAGRPLGAARARGREQLVDGPDGPIHHVLPAAAPAAAALFGLPDLSLSDRLALYLAATR